MATEIFTFNHTTGGALRFFTPSDDKVLDFSDETFKLIASATTPYIAMTAPGAANLGSGRQLNRLGFDLARLHRGPIPKKFWVGKYSGTAPATTVNPTESEEVVVQLGERGAGDLRIETRMSCRTLDGYAVQLMARLMREGRPINPLTCGRALFTADASTDVITSAGHGLSDGDVVVFHTITGTLPTGITAGTAYYVRDSTTDTFKIATTSGGSAVNITTAGTAPNYWDKPTVTFTVREHGASVAAFTKTLTAANVIGGQFEGEYPASAAFTADASTDVITSNSHGLSDTNQIAVQTGPGGTLPGGLSQSTTYFVRDATANTFKLALTSGGTAINITSAGSGTHSWIPATALLTADRQFNVKVSMTLAGETIEDHAQELTIG